MRTLGLGLGLGGAQPWTPLLLPGLTAWYRSDFGVTNISGATSQLLDKSGGGHTATQGTAQNRPTYNSSDPTYGGRPSFGLGATFSQNLGAAGVALSQPDTIYLTGKITPSSGFLTLLDGNSARQAIGTNASNWAMYAGASVVTGGTADSGPHVFAGVFAGASSILYVDGIAVMSNVNPGSGALSGLFLGPGFPGDSPFIGSITETIVCSGAHSAATVKQVSTYLKISWGL